MNKILYFNNGFTQNSDMMISLAIAFFENGELVFESEEYCESPQDIGNGDVNLFGILPDIWPKFKDYFEKADLWACWRAGNHKHTLLKSLERFGIEIAKKPCIDICNFAISRIPDSEFFDREYIADLLKIPKINYESTEIDKVRFTYRVANELLKIEDPNNIFEYYKKVLENKENNVRTFFKKRANENEIGDYDVIEIELAALVGKSILLTGEFELYPKRKDLEMLLKENGINVMKSLSEKLDYIVLGISPGGKKIEFGNYLKSKKEFHFISGENLEKKIP